MNVYREYDDLFEKMKSQDNFEKWQNLNMNINVGKDDDMIRICLKQLNSEMDSLKKGIDSEHKKDLVINSISGNIKKLYKLLIDNGWKI
jgi:hypothetical protein